MSTLVLLRHGQASFGSSHYDALSPLGVAQAQATGRFWASRGQRFTKVHLGPRERHRQTAEGALGPLGIAVPAEREAGLDEFADGAQILASAERRLGVKLLGEGAVGGRQRALHYADEIVAWAEERIEIEGVPSPRVFRDTVAEWLARVTAVTDSGQTVLAVTSGGVVGAMMGLVLDLPLASIGHFMKVTRNASISEFIYAPGRPAALSVFNATGHLAADAQTLI